MSKTNENSIQTNSSEEVSENFLVKKKIRVKHYFEEKFGVSKTFAINMQKHKIENPEDYRAYRKNAKKARESLKIKKPKQVKTKTVEPSKNKK